MVEGKEREFIANRVNLPTSKNSAQIAADIPPEIRARAFFSARVAEAHILERFREISDRYSSGEISRGEAMNLLKEYARSQGKDDGSKGLRNLASTARLNLILDQNAKMARAVGQYEAMHRPANLKMFPYVIYQASVGSRSPRDSHRKYDGMVIDKRDPWLRTHWPPWEFGCNCDLLNCSEKKARTLGSIKPMSKPEDLKIESDSGFAFDPTTWWKEYDCSIIKSPEFRANVIDDMAKRFPDVTGGIYRSNATGYLEGKAAELERRIQTEAAEKVFPAEPKTFLKGENLAKAQAQARKAVAPEVMQATDDAVAKIGADGIEPFMHYSSRPRDSENIVLRQAAFKDGEIDWTGVDATPKRKKAVADLQHLLEIMPKFYGTLYRGCAFETKEARDAYLKTFSETPENLMGFISTTPDPVVAHHYASAGKYKIVIVIPNSKNGVYFGPYSRHPEDEEALISYKFFLRGLKKYEKDGILYILAEELPR